MSLPVKLRDVIEALDVGGDQLSHYLDKRTGEIFMLTDEEISAAEEDELISDYPEWQRESILKAREILDSNDFVELPSQFDLNEYAIMERFALAYEDRRTSTELLRSIKGKGAFRRFKDAVIDLGIRDEWHEFRRDEIEEIAVQWLEEERIPFTREDEIEESSDTAM